MLMNSRGVLGAIAACLGFSASYLSAGMITNLGEAELGGHTQVHATHWVAQGFTVDGLNYNLTSVTLGMKAATDSSGNFVVQIRDDASGSPGSTVLATLSGSSNPFGAANHVYTGNLLLSANQTYYVVAGVTSGSGNYSWKGTFSDNQTGDLAWNIGDVQFSSTGSAGASWPTTTDVANFITLEATVAAVPEPTSMALLGLASVGGIALRLRRRRRAKDVQTAA